MSIMGNMVGGTAPLKTLIIQDENGAEFVGAVVGEEVIFTATDNDVREGSVYAGDAGVSTGTKVIPAYHTIQGYRVITNGSVMTLPNIKSDVDSYDYTKMQAIICDYNSTLLDSVAARQVSIDNNLYNVQSTESVAVIVKNHDSKTIEFGVSNDTGAPLIIRYFMYKEIE